MKRIVLLFLILNTSFVFAEEKTGLSDLEAKSKKTIQDLGVLGVPFLREGKGAKFYDLENTPIPHPSPMLLRLIGMSYDRAGQPIAIRSDGRDVYLHRHFPAKGEQALAENRLTKIPGHMIDSNYRKTLSIFISSEGEMSNFKKFVNFSFLDSMVLVNNTKFITTRELGDNAQSVSNYFAQIIFGDSNKGANASQRGTNSVRSASKSIGKSQITADLLK